MLAWLSMTELMCEGAIIASLPTRLEQGRLDNAQQRVKWNKGHSKSVALVISITDMIDKTA